MTKMSFQPKYQPPYLLLLIITLLSTTAVALTIDETHFALYKNTDFLPCPSLPSTNLTAILSADPNALIIKPGPSNTFSTSITNTTLYCALFPSSSNYTIIPSTPLGSAYLYTDTNTLIQFLIFNIKGIFFVYFSSTKTKNLNYIQILLHIFTIHNITHIIGWWIEFVDLCSSASSSSGVFILGWLTTTHYILLIPLHHRKTRITIYILGLIQFFSTIAALIIKSHPVANYSPIDSLMGNEMIGNCTREKILATPALWMDPNALDSKISDIIVFSLCGLVMLPLLFTLFEKSENKNVIKDTENNTGIMMDDLNKPTTTTNNNSSSTNSTNENTKAYNWGKSTWGFILTWISLIFISPLLIYQLKHLTSQDGPRDLSPVVWMPECGVVNVMLAQKTPSYVDVKVDNGLLDGERGWRIAKLALGL